jgi:hypothetical protein
MVEIPSGLVAGPPPLTNDYFFSELYEIQIAELKYMTSYYHYVFLYLLYCHTMRGISG